MIQSTIEWANDGADTLPRMKTESPGPGSREMHARMDRYQRGSFTPMVALHPVAFESGRGVMLRDVDGNEYLDFSSGIVVASLGHAHPDVADAVHTAMLELSNVHDFAHPRKAEALEVLAEVTPGDLDLATFFCAGTEAVEGAMRVARAATGKNEFLTFVSDYHGRTRGAAEIKHVIPGGHCYRSENCTGGPDHSACGLANAELLSHALDRHGDEIAGVVMEVITNGAGGTVYPDTYIQRVAEICRERDVPLIADEIATGFGRTGEWFASDHYDLVPDIMPIGKSLGGIGMPVTAVSVREGLAEALVTSFPSTSYGGNPMACAAIIETARILREENILEHTRELGEFALQKMKEVQDRHGLVGEVRGKGGLLAMELVKDRESKEPAMEEGTWVMQHVFARGLSLVTAGHILRITPPIVMSKDVFARGLELIEEAIDAAEKHFGYV